MHTPGSSLRSRLARVILVAAMVSLVALFATAARAQSTSTATATDTATVATPTPTALPATGNGTEATGNATDASGDGVFAPGEKGVANFQNLTPSEPYELDFAQSPGVILATGDTDGSGNIVFNFTIPTTAKDGPATLTAQPVDGTGQVETLSITIRSVSLPDTGGNLAVLALAGLTVVELGAGLTLLAGWRRRA